MFNLNQQEPISNIASYSMGAHLIFFFYSRQTYKARISLKIVTWPYLLVTIHILPCITGNLSFICDAFFKMWKGTSQPATNKHLHKRLPTLSAAQHYDNIFLQQMHFTCHILSFFLCFSDILPLLATLVTYLFMFQEKSIHEGIEIALYILVLGNLS